MAAIAAHGDGTSSFTLGGTLTVVGLGAASGLAGAAIALVSRALLRRLVPHAVWPQHALFAALLLLVTLRGLRGTAPAGRWYFLPLVAVYGVMLVMIMSRDSRRPSRLPD